jgi:IclR family transcriptional regulator, pca regulon regulatory protein
MAGNFNDSLVQALANGLRSIEAFESADRRLTLSEVATRAGLTRAAARRYLHTLCALGYAAHDGKYFHLTPRVLKLGYAFITAAPLPNLAQPILEQVGAQTGEVVALSVLDGPDVVFLARSTPRLAASAVNGVGGRLSAFHASSGRVLLAAKPDAQIERLLRKAVPFKRLTPKTKTSPQDILREIRRARRTGYAINDEETEVRVRSVAVPVLTARGNVAGSISLSSRTTEMSLKQMLDDAMPLLRSAAASLAGLL